MAFVSNMGATFLIHQKFMTKQQTLCALFLFLGLSLLLAGCNTVRGVGEDIVGSSNFVEKKMMGCNDDSSSSSLPSNNSNPPQWPK